MKKQKFIATTAFVLTLLVVSIIPLLQPASREAKASVNTDRSLELVNQLRTSSNLNTLTYNESLTNAAIDKAEDCFNKNYFDHISPTGEKAWSFVRSEGYNYVYAGENLGADFNTVDQAFEGWKKSPTHLENILSDKFDEYGFAQKSGLLNGEETTIYVQIFASKKSLYDRILYKIGEE